MDIQKAIEWQRAFKKTYNGIPEEVNEACNKAIEALRKRAPMKVKEMKYEPLLKAGWHYECPSCGSAVGENDNAIEVTQEDDFCPSCGQKLDWN